MERWERRGEKVEEERRRVLERYKEMMEETEGRIERARVEKERIKRGEVDALSTPSSKSRDRRSKEQAMEDNNNPTMFENMSQSPPFRPSTSVLRPPGDVTTPSEPASIPATRVLQSPGGGRTFSKKLRSSTRVFAEKRGSEEVYVPSVRVKPGEGNSSSQIDLTDDAEYPDDRRSSVKIVPQPEQELSLEPKPAVKVSQTPGGDER